MGARSLLIAGCSRGPSSWAPFIQPSRPRHCQALAPDGAAPERPARWPRMRRTSLHREQPQERQGDIRRHALERGIGRRRARPRGPRRAQATRAQIDLAGRARLPPAWWDRRPARALVETCQRRRSAEAMLAVAHGLPEGAGARRLGCQPSPACPWRRCRTPAAAEVWQARTARRAAPSRRGSRRRSTRRPRRSVHAGRRGSGRCRRSDLEEVSGVRPEREIALVRAQGERGQRQHLRL